MKIIPKLTAALVAGTCVILGTNGALRVRRERRFFEAEHVREHEMVGRSLETAAAAVWKSDGQQAAVDAIDAASRHSSNLTIRWIPLSSTPGQNTDIDPTTIRGLRTGEPVTIAPPAGGDSLWRTYVALDADGKRQGVIELSEPPKSEDRFLRNALFDTISMTVALIVVSALLAFVMGQWLVGTPVKLLSEKARRIGRGDFAEPVTLKQRDELADLAREVNAMCARLVTTLDQLRHADRLATVGKLASGVAHELGTPLNVVGARARMVAEGETSQEESREYASIIVGATDRMTATIRQLMQFARRSGPEKSRHDLHALTAGAIDLLRPLAKQANVELDLQPVATAAMANVDAGQFQQVVTNLVMNSIQAMRHGGTVRLSVRRGRFEPPAELHESEGDYICLRVEDEGEGIAPEHLQHVFEPFFTTKDVGAGTGLGLAVTYGIVRDHGGWIVAESTVREGAAFSVYLPPTQ